MKWGDEPHRYALLDLWANGSLRKRQRSSEAWTELDRLPWTRRTNRSGELRLLPERQPELERLLDGCWPEWRHVVARLREAGHPVNESGWRALQDQQRREGFQGAPGPRLNRRTAAGVLAEHSKAGLRASHRFTLQGTTLTGDNILRLRPCEGLLIQRDGLQHDAVALARLLGEVVITERAMLEGTRLAGRMPAAVLVVENLGPYVDLPAPGGWLITHGPGWNQAAVKMLLDQLPPDVPVVHFGDLDENGVRIARQTQALRPGVKWFVPEWWVEYLPRGLRGEWSDTLDLGDAPPLVHQLRARRRWLEQELIVLDARLPGALRALVGTPPATAVTKEHHT